MRKHLHIILKKIIKSYGKKKDKETERSYKNSQKTVNNVAISTFVSDVKLLSHVQLFATPCTVTYQTTPSVEFSRQVYWSRLPFPSPRGSSPPRDVCWVHCRQTVYHLSQLSIIILQCK